MEIAIQKLVAPHVLLQSDAQDIVLANNEHYPIAMHALTGRNDAESKWKILFHTEHEKNFRINKKLIQHKTQADNLLCITAHPSFILHHSSWILDKHGVRIPLSSRLRHAIQQEIHRRAAEGNAINAIGIKHIEYNDFSHARMDNLTFVGFGVFPYEISPAARDAVDALRKKNIQVKLFSHDLLETSRTIARKMGIPALPEFSLTSDEIQSMHDRELAPLLDDIHVFAEMNLLDLIRITRLLEQHGHHVRFHY